jgi:riboflavin synthase
MFTGIVEEIGRVDSAERRGGLLVVRVAARRIADGLERGASIAVDGCCLTAVDSDAAGFTCELTGETLARTAFAERLRPGAPVNLERPLRADGRFDGHIVQGHVDGVGGVRGLTRQGGGAELEVALPAALERYVVEKGSIAVDGVSLTVAGLGPGVFRAALIPYTLEHTNLGQAQVGGPVNLEVDVIAKYVERLLGGAGGR